MMQLPALQSLMSSFSRSVVVMAVVFATCEGPVAAANTRGAVARGALQSAAAAQFQVDSHGNPLTQEDKLQKMILNSGFQVEIQFLMVTSPKNGRVIYTRLRNFESDTGRTFVLVEDGLVNPMGIAFDRKSGTLYVADPGVKKVFAYTVLVDKKDSKNPGLTATARSEILVGKPFKWVSVDGEQNLWFTSTDTPDINKISYEVIQKLRDQIFLPSSLSLVSEKEIEAAAAADAAKHAIDPAPTDAPELAPQIFTMYEGKINPHVSEPGMILADGLDLFWTNLKNGSKAGTVVVGSADPHLDLSANIGNQTSGVQAFPAKEIVLAQDTAYGLAVTGSRVLYTSNKSEANSGVVFCVDRIGGANQVPLKMVSNLQTPRGIAHDNDYTAYVADEETGKIYSFPTGRLMENAPLKEVVAVEGPYAVAMFGESDPAFKIEGNSGAQRSTSCLASFLLVVGASVSAIFT